MENVKFMGGNVDAGVFFFLISIEQKTKKTQPPKPGSLWVVKGLYYSFNRFYIKQIDTFLLRT